MRDQSTCEKFFGCGTVIKFSKDISSAVLQLKLSVVLNRRTFICLVL